jgi:hypothetical protein
MPKLGLSWQSIQSVTIIKQRTCIKQKQKPKIETFNPQRFSTFAKWEH